MKLRTAAFTAAALALSAVPAVLTAPALAAPDHSGVLSAAKPKFDWQGGVTVSAGVPNGVRESIPCKTPAARPCEDVLLEVTDAGKLTVKVDGGPGGPPNDDVDVTLYKSDKDGKVGEQVAQGIAAGPDSVSTKVVPGFYLAQVEYYRAKATGYIGSAVLAATAPPAAAITTPVAGPPTPTTTAPAKPKQTAKQKAAAKRKACQKKAKKIKNKKKRSKALKKCSKIK